MNVRIFTYLNLCQNCSYCAYAYHTAVDLSYSCRLIAMLWVHVLLLKRSFSPLLSAEDRRRYLHGAFMLHTAHIHVCLCALMLMWIRFVCFSHNRWVETFSEYFSIHYVWRPVSPRFRIFWYLDWISVLNAQKICSHITTLLVTYLGSAANTTWDRDDVSYPVLYVGLMVTLLFAFQLKVVMYIAFAVQAKCG
jgi:hypothetical protein